MEKHQKWHPIICCIDYLSKRNDTLGKHCLKDMTLKHLKLSMLPNSSPFHHIVPPSSSYPISANTTNTHQRQIMGVISNLQTLPSSSCSTSIQTYSLSAISHPCHLLSTPINTTWIQSPHSFLYLDFSNLLFSLLSTELLQTILPSCYQDDLCKCHSGPHIYICHLCRPRIQDGDMLGYRCL